MQRNIPNVLDKICDSYFNRGHDVCEFTAFQGSIPYGLYPHWQLTNSYLPSIVQTQLSVETFKDKCLSMASDTSDIKKINAIHLLVSQLVHLPINNLPTNDATLKTQGYRYENIGASKDNPASPLYQYREKQKNVEDITDLDTHAFMPTSVNLENRFADCRTTNALLAWGLSLAGVQNIKWTYVYVSLYPELNPSTPNLELEGDHALLIWKKMNQNLSTNYYVLDGYNIHFHGMPLANLISKKGILTNSARYENQKNIFSAYPHISKNQFEKIYSTRKNSGALLFPRSTSAKRLDGLNCYHASNKTAEMNKDYPCYFLKIEKQCDHPKVISPVAKL